MAEVPIVQSAGGSWSEQVKGLSGRVRPEFEDLRPGIRYAVYLELRNDSLDPVAVVNQPRVNAEVFDSSGQLVAASGASAGGPMPIPQWAVIPRGAYVGFRIDMQTVGAMRQSASR